MGVARSRRVRRRRRHRGGARRPHGPEARSRPGLLRSRAAAARGRTGGAVAPRRGPVAAEAPAARLASLTAPRRSSAPRPRPACGLHGRRPKSPPGLKPPSSWPETKSAPTAPSRGAGPSRSVAATARRASPDGRGVQASAIAASRSAFQVAVSTRSATGAGVRPGRRILRAEGLNRRPVRAAPEKPAGAFKEYELGFVHIDVKHLPELRTSDGELRKRYLFVAIDRRSRSVHLAVEDEETEASAKAFLKETLAAFPFRVTRVLTDRGSCFTAEGFEELCRDLGVEHRKTKPCTPRTNGMVERFNGRVQREVLGITVAGHRDLERLLEGFNQAYNARRQRVLDGRSPEEVVRERLAQDRGLANPGYRPPSDPCVLPRAMLVIERAKEVSQPDT